MSFSNEQLQQLTAPLFEAMNKMVQTPGYTPAQSIAAAAYAVGAALRQTGVVLDLNAPICNALAPLADGYMQAASQQARRSN